MTPTLTPSLLETTHMRISLVRRSQRVDHGNDPNSRPVTGTTFSIDRNGSKPFVGYGPSWHISRESLVNRQDHQTRRSLEVYCESQSYDRSSVKEIDGCVSLPDLEQFAGDRHPFLLPPSLTSLHRTLSQNRQLLTAARKNSRQNLFQFLCTPKPSSIHTLRH